MRGARDFLLQAANMRPMSLMTIGEFVFHMVHVHVKVDVLHAHFSIKMVHTYDIMPF
jgi:hypothetical protein